MSRLAEKLNLFIVGASGFVGRHLNFSGDDRITRADRLPTGELVARLIASRPDYVINLAADGVFAEGRAPERLFNTNLELPFELARACLALGCTLVHFGTCFEHGFGPEAILPQRFDPSRSYSPYGISKTGASAMLTDMFRDARPRLKIIRPYNLFGPGEKEPRLFPALAAAQNQFAVAAPESRRNFIYIDDFANWFEAWLRAPSRQFEDRIVEAAFEPAVSVVEFAEAVRAARLKIRGPSAELDLKFSGTDSASCYVNQLIPGGPNFRGWRAGIVTALTQGQV